MDTVVAGGWLLTMNPRREMYRAGGVAIDGGVIVEVGQRADLLTRYSPRRLIDAPDGVITPGLVNGHRHLLCCAKGAMPEGGQTLDALRQFIYPSFAALTEEDMYVHAQHAAAEMIRFGTTLFEEPGCNHLAAVLEALAASGIRARTGPWTWDQAGAAGRCRPARLAADGRQGRAVAAWPTGSTRCGSSAIPGSGTRSRSRAWAPARTSSTGAPPTWPGTRKRCSCCTSRPASARSSWSWPRSASARSRTWTTIGALHERVLLNHMTSLDDRDVGSWWSPARASRRTRRRP